MYKFKVEGMTCNRCVHHINQDLKEHDESIEITGDVKTKILSVKSTKLNKDQVVKAIEASGYLVSGDPS